MDVGMDGAFWAENGFRVTVRVTFRVTKCCFAKTKRTLKRDI